MEKAELYRRIAEEADRGELVFPTHVEVGLRIKRALDDPDCSIDQAAKLIQAEPLLAALNRAKKLAEGEGTGPVILLDHCDNCGSGGTQDSMTVIEAVMKHGGIVTANSNV